MLEKANHTLPKQGEKAPTLWGWHTYLSIAIAVVILGILAALVDLEKIWNEVVACDKRLVLLGALCHYATYPVRGLRWRRCLIHLPITGGNRRFALLVFFYNFVDNLVPAKLGDLYGAHLARINCGIGRSAALGSIVFLRMMDAWIVLFLAMLSSWFLFSRRLPEAVVWALMGGVLVAVTTTLIMLFFFLVKRSLPLWLPAKIQQMIHGFRSGMWPSPREIIPVAFLTVLIWVLETLWITLLALGFGIKLGFAEALFLTMIPLLATAFPVTPSGAGVVELTLFSCLRVLGLSAPLAGSLTVVNRFLDFWLHIGLGVILWAMRGKIGLRTWREVPLEDFRSVHAFDASVKQEDFS